GRLEEGGAGRTATAAEQCRAEAGGAAAAEGGRGQRLPDRALDAGAGGQDGGDGDRGCVPPRARLAAAPTNGLEPAEAGTPCPGAGRGRDRALGERDLAGGEKNAARKQAWIVFQDESGLSLLPVIRRTWAPRGRTPILRHPFNWKRVSLAGALAYRWDGRRVRTLFQTHPGSYDTP